jgi:hypothetical protein
MIAFQVANVANNMYTDVNAVPTVGENLPTSKAFQSKMLREVRCEARKCFCCNFEKCPIQLGSF